MPKLIFFGDSNKEPVAKALAEFKRFVKHKAEVQAFCHFDHCTREMLQGCDFAVVFGGDGTIIAAARYLSQTRIPIIGVNLGKLGFLAEFSVRELKALFDDIIRGKVSVERRMMLSCQVQSSCDTGPRSPHYSPVRFSGRAINDVFIAAGPPYRVIELEIRVNGQHVAGCVSDGLVISTPTGSTAYNLSAGGPILTSSITAMVLTPICAHSLSFRPIVMDAHSVIEIVGTSVNEGTTLSIDGQVSLGLTERDRIRIQKARSDFRVVNNPMRNNWDTLAAKLGWAEKPKNV